MLPQEFLYTRVVSENNQSRKEAVNEPNDCIMRNLMSGADGMPVMSTTVKLLPFVVTWILVSSLPSGAAKAVEGAGFATPPV